MHKKYVRPVNTSVNTPAYPHVKILIFCRVYMEWDGTIRVVRGHKVRKVVVLAGKVLYAG